MKYLGLMAAAIGVTLLVGCAHGGPYCGYGNWDWYKECDLIEGRCCCNPCWGGPSCPCDVCGDPGVAPGFVSSRCYAVPVAPEQAAPATVEEAPAPAAQPGSPDGDGK